ncbi:MAG: peptidase M23 [Paracoccus denitrificans]|nr:MAG: peptidase M23 [Paracoccus denitrificans]PZO85978.1 MAG: peptidase M23 [Paracoccus denitrificans]
MDCQVTQPATTRPSFLERLLPEKRLFLKSEDSTRFVRLRPSTQLGAIMGGVLVVGWAIAATSVLAIDRVTAGSNQSHAALTQSAFEQRLADLSAERDTRAAEAKTAQDRFSAALEKVSGMQSDLLAANERQRALESGMGAVQASLKQALADRDVARRQLADASTKMTDAVPAAARAEELSTALNIVSEELKTSAANRIAAKQEAEEATQTAQALAAERDQMVARNDEIFSRLEDAVSLSIKPMDDMFQKAGFDSDKVLDTIATGYSGQGGPLTPAGVSTRGNAAISQSEARAEEIIVSLDKVNRYRIAASKLPLAMPVKSAFRYSSPFGKRWGRSHEGIDLAAPIGTQVFAPGDGVVTFAGWQNGYGRLIKIQHELGTETRYGHLSKINVKVGQRVSRNSPIGAIGNTGRSTGPHLHYEVRVNGRAVNPMSFIKAAENVF